jgi:hypothetical protein
VKHKQTRPGPVVKPVHDRIKNLGNFAHPAKKQTRTITPKLIHAKSKGRHH